MVILLASVRKPFGLGMMSPMRCGHNRFSAFCWACCCISETRSSAFFCAVRAACKSLSKLILVSLCGVMFFFDFD